MTPKQIKAKSLELIKVAEFKLLVTFSESERNGLESVIESLYNVLDGESSSDLLEDLENYLND